MASKRQRILGQDKDITGKLSKTTVKSAIGKFKEQYADRCDNPTQPIAGFELNGGTGMTKGGQEEWNNFQKWCDEKNLHAEYNSNDDLSKMKTILRNRVENKLKNKV
jgi:cytochrome c556